MRRSLRLILILILLSLSSAFAQSAQWTVDDIVMSEEASDFQISPDGHWAVWVKNLPDKEKGEHVQNLILSNLIDKRDIELTRGSENCCKPQWSTDGQLIAFISTRATSKTKPPATDSSSEEEPKAQLWLINPFGGEPWPLTESPREVVSFAWADADTIIFLAQEDPTLYESNIKENKDTSVV